MKTSVEGVKHEGVVVRIGDAEYILPRLSAGGLKRHWPKIKELRNRVKGAAKGLADPKRKGQLDEVMDEVMDAAPDLMGAQIALIHSALKRNYPSLTIEALEDSLDLSDVKHVFETLLSFSQMERTDEVKEGAPGEAESPKS